MSGWDDDRIAIMDDMFLCTGKDKLGLAFLDAEELVHVAVNFITNLLTGCRHITTSWAYFPVNNTDGSTCYLRSIFNGSDKTGHFFLLMDIENGLCERVNFSTFQVHYIFQEEEQTQPNIRTSSMQKIKFPVIHLASHSIQKGPLCAAFSAL